MGAGEVRYLGEIGNDCEAIAKLVRRLKSRGTRLSFCYEAGPCGYGIERQIKRLGAQCSVIAPTLIPKKAGDRVKTDRRDSLSLARLHRAGELTAVWVPDGEHEALRDLVRARGDQKGIERRARQQLQAFLLRHGHRYDGKTRWTQAHYRWIESVKFVQPVQQIVLQEYVDTVLASTARLAGLDRQIEQAAHAAKAWPVIEALMALRGVQLLTAATVVSEIGDLTRFANARQLMAYLGLVPGEHSSGERCRRGGITKTGNSHVRRVLVEAAWTYRYAARKTATLQRRAERCEAKVQAIAWEAQKRLCARHRHLAGTGKLPVQVTTAVARELAGFIWAIGQAVALQTGKSKPAGKQGVAHS
ncbi:MAG: IS110 family transposase [Betaproteobacteria bacterium]|nr:IS110 family transposase [Betaproteobacteria bacterium]